MNRSDTTSAPPIGLIAGEGIFPILVARGARAMGRKVVCASLGGFAADEVKQHVDVHEKVGLMRLGQWIRVLKRGGCTQAIMVGRVPKKAMYAGGRIGRWLQFVPDLRTISLYVRRIRHDKRDSALLAAVADELQSAGITLIDSTTFSKDQLASEGQMTKRSPTARQQADAQFGWTLCQTISRLDIGQSLAVVDKDVIAVEAMEGTDAMIRRAGELCKTSGWTLIKVSNALHDMRVDVPSVGVQTIENLSKAGCGCVVVEVGRVIMLDKEAVLKRADELGIAVIGVEAGGVSS
jgi:UDP-2,3-diacylglucosamine hydrolase